MDLDGYQRAAYTTAQRFPADKSDPVLMPLLRLGAAAGSLLGEYERTGREDGDLERFKRAAVKELGGVLWYAAGLASRLDLRLTEVAQLNLMRNRARWQPPSEHFTLLDAHLPTHVQLPRQFTIRFVTIAVEGRERVRMLLDGQPVGDPLTDNAYEDIGYRFHDVCHLANAAVLGWSPVVRALLKRKRRSDPMVDEVEDGGRAIVIEEGIGSLIFAHARQTRFFEGATRVDGTLLLPSRAWPMAWKWKRAHLRIGSAASSLAIASGGSCERSAEGWSRVICMPGRCGLTHCPKLSSNLLWQVPLRRVAVVRQAR